MNKKSILYHLHNAFYRCLIERNCFAYQYKEAHSVNCILLEKNCSDPGDHTFENNYNSVIYEKGLLLCSQKFTM